MKGQKKKQNGITLIALVISIIVMLILAGVSINATVGENGIITKAQIATLATKFASYIEEMEMNITSEISNETVNSREEVTAFGEEVKKYIPNLSDEDLGNLCIISGELYYLGEDKVVSKAAINQNIICKAEDYTVAQWIAQLENMAIQNKELYGGKENFEYNDEKEGISVGGIALHNKSLADMGRWKIVIETNEDEGNKVYGTGWYLVPKGTVVKNIGVTSNDYIINYQTNEVVPFNSDIHSLLTYESVLGVSDGLIFNIDPGLCEDIYKELLQGHEIDPDVFGEGVEFHGYGSEDSTQNLLNAFTKSSFTFDGTDDYIKMPYTTNQSFKTGQTYEFYGVVEPDDGTSHAIYNSSGRTQTNPYGETIIGIFTVGNGTNQSWDTKMRYTYLPYPSQGYYHYVDDKATLYFNICGTLNSLEEGDDRYRLGTIWDQADKDTYDKVRNPNYPNIDTQHINDIYFETGKVIDICITTDPENELISVYLDGELATYSSFYADRYVDTVMSNEANNLLEDIIIGKTTAGGSSFWHYMKGECYSLKLYNRALSAEEVATVHESTKEYHDFLVGNE